MIFKYSQIASDSVLELIQHQYRFQGTVTCRYYVLGLHDNYLIECGVEKYIFRLYRNDWRTVEDIQFELALLAFCQDKELNVSTPVPCANQERYIVVDCPEGRRLGVLFDYADGYSVQQTMTNKEFNLLGASVANFHIKTREFETAYTRPVFDLEFLVDRSLQIIAPFLNDRQIRYLKTLRTIIHKGLSRLSRVDANYGICMGDVNISNFHITDSGKITHFDFDQCGYGFRAFELGKFASSIPNDAEKNAKVTAFLTGYESVRLLTDIEIKSIPYFELASIIWVMSIHACNADRIGYKFLQDDFWMKRIDVLERLEGRLLS